MSRTRSVDAGSWRFPFRCRCMYFNATAYTLSNSPTTGHMSLRQILAQNFRQPVRIGLRRHEAKILAVAAHQIDDAGMIDRILPAPLIRHFRIKRLVGIGDLSNLLRRTGETDQAWVKRRDIVREHFGVPLRIDRDEDGLDTLGRGAERIERLADRH